MRLEYSIVWFEDSEEYINSLEPQIKEYLKELGFDLDLKRISGDINITEVITNKDVNLILVDQKLSNGRTGADLIETIRNNEFYTEAVFYSAFSGFPGKIKQQLEGVYYTKRDNLLEKTKKVINLTIKKNQDISNVRGLFIAETIDLTDQMEKIISKILKLSGPEREFFEYSIVQDEFLNEFAKFRIIKRFLRQEIAALEQKIQKSGDGKTDLTELKTGLERVNAEFTHFQNDVIELRNQLAHAKKSPDKKNVLIIRNEEREFNEEECQRIRESFIKHAKNLEELERLLDKL